MTLLYVSAINSHPHGDINKKEYKIHPIYICNVKKNMATVMQM
jgi:hypothetical protein